MKTISILDIPPGLPGSAPEYERRKGQYKFAPTGEMVYESNGTKYRTKTNGVWNDWKNFTY